MPRQLQGTLLLLSLVLLTASRHHRPGSSAATTPTTSTATSFVFAFAPPIFVSRQKGKANPGLFSATQENEATATNNKSNSNQGSYAPRTGILQSLLNVALRSPLWDYVLVPQARKTMVDTAEANGIAWRQQKEWMEGRVRDRLRLGSSSVEDWPDLHSSQESIPEYYKDASFHAYQRGNLCWDAGLEQEIASRAVGARNFPKFGVDGDTAFRGAFAKGLDQAGARLPSHTDVSGSVVAVDMGCGTGLSSRSLASSVFITTDGQEKMFDKVLGMDLSPYYIEVGQTLLELDETQRNDWINSIDPRSKDIVELKVANVDDTQLPSDSVDIVQILFVLHELPAVQAANVIREAHRILKPSTGQLWMGEMDFQAPHFAAQRANPLLFSLIRATEPYLDDYADGFATHVQPTLVELFDTVTWTAATGRHYACVATKGSSDTSSRGSGDGGDKVIDKRFLSNGDYAIEDTHLQLWENKQ